MIAELFQIFNQAPATAPAIEEVTINPGDLVYVYDDQSGQAGWAIFTCVYATLRGETSPFWGEHVAGIHRAMVREILINPDGSVTERPNYILLENIWHESEVNVFPFAS
jgi:hypothetical protein